MGNISYTFENPVNLLSEPISRDMFGTAFENRGQTVDAGSPVTNIIGQLPISLLRFPGGSQTESFFNPSSPENPRPRDYFSGTGIANFVPISEFISYVSAHNIRPVFVIPTYRYFDADAPKRGYLTWNAEAQIQKFVKDLVAGTYGTIDIAAFEIGNEWFASRMLYNPVTNPEGWTAEQFGTLQGKIALIVREAITEVGLQSRPDVWIQSSQSGDSDLDNNGIRDNVEFLNSLSLDALQAIDGVIDHFYQPTRAGTPLEVMSEGWVSSSRIDKLIADGWDVGASGSLDIIASEWNVRAARNGVLSGNEANITGFERLSLFLALFADMVLSGVDTALVYTAQALGSGGGDGTLSLRGSTTLTPTGLLFKLMANALVETQIADPNSDGKLDLDEIIFQDVSGNDVGVTYTFVGNEKIVIYFASTVLETSQITFAGAGGLIDSGYTFKASILEVVNGQDPLVSNAQGQVRYASFSSSYDTHLGNSIFEFSLGAYEIIQLEFTMNPRMVGQPSTAMVDFNYGLDSRTSQHEVRNGDTVIGRISVDTLFSSLGDAELYGSDGNDRLVGGGGRDHIIGGKGQDVIVLHGDSVFTENYIARNASATFQTGTDSSVNLNSMVRIESVTDGGAGTDTIELSGNNDAFFLHDSISGFHNSVDLSPDSEGRASFPRFSNVEKICGMGGDDIIDLTSPDYSLAGLVLTIEGGVGDDTIWGSDANEFIFGGEGDDVLFSGAGTDILAGGNGADTFEFTRSSEDCKILDFDPYQGDMIRFYNSGGAVFSSSSLELTIDGFRISYVDQHDETLHIINVEVSLDITRAELSSLIEFF